MSPARTVIEVSTKLVAWSGTTERAFLASLRFASSSPSLPSICKEERLGTTSMWPHIHARVCWTVGWNACKYWCRHIHYIYNDVMIYDMYTVYAMIEADTFTSTQVMCNAVPYMPAFTFAFVFVLWEPRGFHLRANDAMGDEMWFSMVFWYIYLLGAARMSGQNDVHVPVCLYLSNSDFCPLEFSPNLRIEDKALLKHDQHSPRCFSLHSFNEDQSFKVGYPNVGKSSLFNAFVGRIHRKLTKESIFFEEV